jgi:hypothetical protein
MEETNNQILTDIQNLQAIEQEMFSDLEENPDLTQQQQQAIVQKINQISSMRLNLYQTLNGVTGYFQNSLYNTQGTLKEQEAAINIVEDELNRAKEKLRILEEEKNNKIRLIEINTYYGEKYQEHAELMKIIIFTLVPIIILAILNNKGLIPNSIFYGLVTIIAIVGAYYMWVRLASIWSRSNMNYQEYNWPVYQPVGTATSPSQTATNDDPWDNGVYINTGTGTGCEDQSCCATGTTYDASINQCIVTGSTPPTPSPASATQSSTPSIFSDISSGLGSITGLSLGAPNSSESFFSLGSANSSESFVNFNKVRLNDALTRHSRIAKKPDATLNSNYQPNTSESFINFK